LGFALMSTCGGLDPLFADDVTIPDVIRNVWSDQKAIVTAPARADRQDWLVWTLTTAGATGLAVRWNGHASLDERAADPFKDASGSGKSAMQGVTSLGNGGVLFGLSAAGYGWGRWQDQARMAEVSAHWFEALSDASIWGMVIKVVAGRSRPEAPSYRSDFLGISGYFKNSGKNSSFVSGHTLDAFATAAVFSREFDTPSVSIPAYALASAVGFSRVYLEQHWTSDVLVGAVLGQCFGTLVENRRTGHKPDAQGQWSPWVDREGDVGVVWQRRF
jgi:hypothetical protein